MKIIRPYMRMLTSGAVVLANKENEIDHIIDPALHFINWCGRISHRSEDAEKQDVERFLRSVVLDHGDWSITEHTSISVDAVVDRGITHEIVRHRIAAYTQESTRFVNYEKKMPPSFIYPIPEVECPMCLDGNPPNLFSNGWWHNGTNSVPKFKCFYNDEWLTSINTSENVYKTLVKKAELGGRGWRPQEARSVFPNALASRIVITYNLRTWRHFFLMRTSAEAHPQMRQVTIPLLEEFKRRIPVLYEDIIPNSRQVDNLKLGR